jgi:3-oxoacyl-[acyl-carrier protein] reductase
MDMKLRGRSALICGGSSGIGLGCARAFAEEGVRIVLAARDPGRLELARASLQATGREIIAVAIDLASSNAVEKLVEASGDIDILVTNPGESPAADIVSAGLEWATGIDQIVARPMAIIEAYVSGMRARGFGRIINITSSAVAFASAGLAFSGALRAALTHASANLARRVAADGVTVNNIAPGPVETEGLQAYFDRMAREQGVPAAAVRALRLQDIPTRRFAEAEEIGRMAVFLASPYAANLTGRTMLMDGGANPYPFL